ncbi:MAG: hypothetical protein D6815_10450 [Candidatus Dadabacteria bacterium]|nr:MAG: hypothetical protein D6815_10450 [Candidatus Dadabacteria bacterium]
MARTPLISPIARKWFRLALAAVGLTGALAGVVATATVYNVRVDLSPGNRFTLSDHALAVLHGLKQPVRITGFIRTGDARNPVLKDLLWQAARESPMIRYELVDVNKHPTRAAAAGVSTYGATVVESGGRRATFTIPSEHHLISALIHVTAPPARVYVTVGHGECDFASQDRKTGCSEARAALLLELYEVEKLNVAARGEVPSDADVLLIAGPQRDFLPAEIEALDRYLAAGGDALVLLDPFRAPRLAALLARYGVEAGENVVLDPDNRLAGGEPLSAVVGEISRVHPVTAMLESPVLLVGMRSVRVVKSRATGVWLLKSGRRSWATADPAVLEGARPRFVAGRDLNGPLAVAVAATVRPSKQAGEEERTRLVVVGDSDLISNRFLAYLSNRDFLVNAVNWLARQEQLIGVRAPAKTPGVNWLFVSQQDLAVIFWAAAVVEPGLFALVGVFLFVWRRLAP